MILVYLIFIVLLPNYYFQVLFNFKDVPTWYSVFFSNFYKKFKKNLHVNVSISCLSDFMECCFSVICLVYSKGLSVLNLTLHLNQ